MDNESTFVLYDGSTVTVYYSYSTSNVIINTAKTFVNYIANFEEKEYDVNVRISEYREYWYNLHVYS